jgi:ribosomal protein L37AE/L43A
MVILNFTVPFALEAIPKGLKKRTMRPVRANPNSVWNRLFKSFTACNNFRQKTLFSNDPISHDKPYEFEIKLQLWWQQRSRKYHCPICAIKMIPPKEVEVKVCSNCGTINIFPEAHKLADAVLVNMTIRTLRSLTEEEWEADGFEKRVDGCVIPNIMDSAKNEGFKWFMETYKITREDAEYLSVYILEWELV